MESINPKEIGGNIDAILTRVIVSKNPLILKQDNEPAVIMLSLDEFNSLQETLYLLSNPANYSHLQKSMQDLETDQGISVNLEDL